MSRNASSSRRKKRPHRPKPPQKQRRKLSAPARTKQASSNRPSHPSRTTADAETGVCFFIGSTSPSWRRQAPSPLCSAKDITNRIIAGFPATSYVIAQNAISRKFLSLDFSSICVSEGSGFSYCRWPSSGILQFLFLLT